MDERNQIINFLLNFLLSQIDAKNKRIAELEASQKKSE